MKNKPKNKVDKEDIAPIFAGPEIAMPNFFNINSNRKKNQSPSDESPTITPKKNPSR